MKTPLYTVVYVDVPGELRGQNILIATSADIAADPQLQAWQALPRGTVVPLATLRALGYAP